MVLSRNSQRLGGSVVDFALVLPIYLMIIFGILEYARYLFAMDVFNNAAREGARYAVTNCNNGVTLTDVQNYVNNTYMAGVGSQLQNYVPTGANNVASIRCYRCDQTGAPLSSWLATNDWTNAAYGTPIAVEITGQFKPLVPVVLLLIPGTLNVSAKCIMYSEAN
jgi:Flp pilus assembly protein TadG